MKSSRSPGEKAGTVPAITVWLVENDQGFRNRVARILNEAQNLACPQQYSNSEDALTALVEGSVADVIMLDIASTGTNGIEAIRRIKALSPSTRIIILTARDSHEEIFRAICSGATGYLLKSSRAEKIIEAVHEVHAGGAPMSPHVARSVLDMFARLSPPQIDYGLTARERTILELMVQGLIKKEIAAQTSLSYHTVDTHLRNIYTKLQVHNRSGAVAKALKERLF